MRSRFLALGTLLMLAFVSLTSGADPWDTPDAKWRLGPVKYLLTKDEDQEYRKLKTDDERKTYVEQFWARRDPSPQTPENEYRDAFYQRAREAAARFSEESGKGWQDDRGKVYILLGPPDETPQGTSELGATGAGSSDTPTGPGRLGAMGSSGDTPAQAPVKTMKFVYKTNPLTGKPERFELNFRSEVTGGYRLDEKIDWNNPILRGLAPSKRIAAAAKPAASAPAAPTPSPSQGPQGSQPPSVPPAAGAPSPQTPPPAPEVTPQSELMQQVRSAGGAAPTLALDVTPNFYKAAKGTLTTLTLEIRRSALPAGADPASLVIAAELLNPETGESVQRFFKQEQFGGYEGNSSGDPLLFQAERPVNPGKYKAVFAVRDPASGAVGKLEKDLEIPDYETGELTLSSVTIASKAEPLADPPAADKLTPFVLGNFKVVPRYDAVYKPGDEVVFYYQIYNATNDPTTNVPKMELSYAVEVNISGTWRMLGGRPLLFPGQTGLVQAYALPLTSRPPGDYRLTIKVADTLATPPKTVSAVVPFKLVGPAPSKAKAKSKG